jgi:hypothetical protein
MSTRPHDKTRTMKTNKPAPTEESDANKQQTSGGRVSRLVHFLLNASAVIACIMAILWLAKCPGNLEWWRSICIGFTLPIIKRFL